MFLLLIAIKAPLGFTAKGDSAFRVKEIGNGQMFISGFTWGTFEPKTI
jgi:hypothetical protein